MKSWKNHFYLFDGRLFGGGLRGNTTHFRDERFKVLRNRLKNLDVTFQFEDNQDSRIGNFTSPDLKLEQWRVRNTVAKCFVEFDLKYELNNWRSHGNNFFLQVSAVTVNLKEQMKIFKNFFLKKLLAFPT